MQNKGFVKIFAVLLTLVCLFYLSFSFVTSYYTGRHTAGVATVSVQLEKGDNVIRLSNPKKTGQD